MNENYLMLNGKRIELTDEQIEKLGLKIEEPSCFNRGSYYYYILPNGKVSGYTDKNDIVDNEQHKVANYCTDKKLMKQRALHETLSRLLWRFSMQNKGDYIDWDPVSDHCTDKYCIAYNHYNKRFDIYSYETSQTLGTIYFHKKEIAQRAIDEIIVPFMEEHPGFVW